MLNTRRSLTEAILEILSDGIPRKATIILKTLAQNGFHDVARGQINSILYRDLKGKSLEVDAEYQWHLKRKTDTVPLPKDYSDTGSSCRDLAAMAANLRTVQRLRCGLPPFECMEELTIGQERSMPALLRLLRGDTAIARWLYVAGDYGQGKSHSLALVRELAHKEGLATCYLCADGSGSALNHPQRFLPNLLSTLEVPSKPGATYRELLTGILTDSANVEFVIKLIRKYIPAGRQIPTYIMWNLTRLKSMTSAGRDTDFRELRELIGYLASALAGEFIRHDPVTPRVKQIAYMLLHVARDLIMRFWASGLVLMLDEVESVFTKLRDPRSRLGAFRVLAALCQSRKLQGCPIVIAITPDAVREMITAVPEMLRDTGNLPSEPIHAWATALTNGSITTIRCRRLLQEECSILAARVRALYERAYPHKLDRKLGEYAWQEFVAVVTNADIPVRLLVRNVVDFLDGQRYSLR